MLDEARICDHDINDVFFRLDSSVKPVEIGKAGDVALYCGDVPADFGLRLLELCLAAAGEEDVSAFANKSLGSRQLVYSQLEDTWAFRREEEMASVTVRGRVRLSAAEGIRAGVLADMGLAVTSD
ncbi:hypothetical protein FHS21_005708 [Phyllobacterium trifolii]|uniref:Uncharacterized protein n=1 Tax=Phyllobacterium trifolii TaxID=300193 RepID=A0A839UE04_9HYPH|nr:hypothetical protein [Phyllobacterium trifolii]